MSNTTDRFEFTWSKPKPAGTGYRRNQLIPPEWKKDLDSCRWVSGVPTDTPKSKKGDDYITDGVPLGGIGGEPYSPLEEYSALFRTFAFTVPTKQGILEFVTRYGFLGSPVSESILPVGQKGGYGYTGEPHYAWVNEIVKMREIVQLCNMLKRTDAGWWEALNSRFLYVDEKAVKLRTGKPPGGPVEPGILYSSDGWGRDGKRLERAPFSLKDADQLGSAGLLPLQSNQRIADSRLQPSLVDDFMRDASKGGAVVTLTEQYIEGTINQRLRELRATPRVLSRGGGKEWVLEPPSLLGAMWLQLMRGYVGEADYRACVICGNDFEITARSGGRRLRKDRIYCSAACKAVAFREGQAKKSKRRKKL